MKPDRDDVARTAGVSTATVSRVFNMPDEVSAARVKRVLAAARSLGYVPDKNASALRRKSPGVIMLVEQQGSDGFGDRIYDWFYAASIRGMKQVVDASIYQLQLTTVAGPGDIATLGTRRAADGIIYRGSLDSKSLAALRSTKIPYVLVGQTDHGLKSRNIAFIDEEYGGSLAATAFIDRGYSKPAHITGDLARSVVCQARWKGFRNCWSSSPRLIDGELGISGGCKSGMALAPLVRRGKIDCAFIVNDITAVGVVQALTAEGIRIPRDVALIGYDNLPFIQTLPFSLATIDIGFDRLYTGATELLLRVMKTGGSTRLAVQPRFVDGASAGGKIQRVSTALTSR